MLFDYLLWAGVTAFIAFPPYQLGWFSIAGWLMIIGFVLKLLGK